DSSRVRGLMDDLRNNGAFQLDVTELEQLCGVFSAHSVGEDVTEMTIRGVFEETGMIVDPHTAVGIAASRAEEQLHGTPMVVLSTAHPAKFPDAVKRAIGIEPPQPERLSLKLGSEERCTVLPADYATVAGFIDSHANAASSLPGAQA
ncbi:MAG: threonine synthase, partial [Pseudomonadota bacterium]